MMDELAEERIGQALEVVAHDKRGGQRRAVCMVYIWKEVEGVMEDVLDKVSFADICGKLKQKEKVIMYQI